MVFIMVQKVTAVLFIIAIGSLLFFHGTLDNLGQFFYSRLHAFPDFLSRSKIFADNERLKAENRYLWFIVGRDSVLRRENASLRKQLSVSGRGISGLIAASPLGVEEEGNVGRMAINCGGKQGVKKGMPVILPGNILVGVVDEVLPSRSYVVLTTDARLRLEGIVVSLKGVEGIKGAVRGSYGLSAQMEILSKYLSKVKKGDLVLTSSRNEKIPQGLVIGRVQEIKARDTFSELKISPLFALRDLDYLFVIKY